MKLESVTIVLGFHGSELCAVKFVKKTEVVVCALKFKILQIGVTKCVDGHRAGEKEAGPEGYEK